MRNALAALALVLTAVPAQAFIAENGLVVVPTGPDSFTVPWRGKSNTRAFWCAAGDYVRRELGRSGQTRIYHTSGQRGPGQGISFSLSPEGAQRTGLLIVQSNGRPGLSVAHAEIFCRIPPLD